MRALIAETLQGKRNSAQVLKTLKTYLKRQELHLEDPAQPGIGSAQTPPIAIIETLSAYSKDKNP